MLYVQERLANLRYNTSRPSHLQSASKQVIKNLWVCNYNCCCFMQNHMVEQIWVEINRQVNYPLKSCLIALETARDICMDCPLTKYCVSWFTIRVANVGATIVVQAWNNHPIPGMYNYIKSTMCYVDYRTST